MTRVTLDLDALVAAGSLSAEEAAHLKTLAAPNRAPHVLLSIAVIFGALAVVSGVLLLKPSLEMGLALAVMALGGALALRFTEARATWGMLMHAAAMIGGLGVAAYCVMRFEGAAVGHLAAVAVTSVSALTFRNGVLAAAAPLSLGALIGSGTGYWHAAYLFYVQEATLTIVLFGGLAATLFWARPRVPADYELVVTVVARVSFFMANMGFWIGSLWGDYPGEHWAAGENWRAAMEWREAALHVPAGAFSVLWAMALIAAIAVGVRTQRRFLANTAIVFLCIHAYTQFFETFGANAVAMVVAGLSLIAVGVGVSRFDGWLKSQAATQTA